MMQRIDPRLQSVVERACANSEPASRVVSMFEQFIIACFSGTKVKQSKDWWTELLLESPAITKKKDSTSIKAQFLFEADTSKGGFHRLLVHAVAQFHGLQVVSRMLKIQVGDKSMARSLTVSGTIDEPCGCTYHLLNHLSAKKS